MYHQIAHSDVLKDYRKALLEIGAEDNVVNFWKSLNVKDIIYEYQHEIICRRQYCNINDKKVLNKFKLDIDHTNLPWLCR